MVGGGDDDDDNDSENYSNDRDNDNFERWCYNVRLILFIFMIMNFILSPAAV